MKFAAMAFLVALAIYAVAFRSFASLRDAVRTAQLTGETEERYRTYATGKAYVRANWPGAADAEFGAWGDDPEESASHVNSSTDLATGHVFVTVGGFKVRQPWVAAINRINGDPIDFAVADDAEAALQAVAVGTFVTATKTTGGSIRGGGGGWSNALDGKARR